MGIRGVQADAFVVIYNVRRTSPGLMGFWETAPGRRPLRFSAVGAESASAARSTDLFRFGVLRPIQLSVSLSRRGRHGLRATPERV